MTVQEYLNIGYGKSKKNQPGKIIAESTEGVALVNRVIRTFFQLGVRVNPMFFVGTALVAYDDSESGAGPGWPRPAEAEAIFKIENDEGDEVVVVPWDDLSAESGKPAVYRMGQVYQPAGNDLDPAEEDDLTFFFAKRPTDAILLTEDVDVMWPDAYAELPGYEIALYLAQKDGRTEEMPTLIGERDNWLRMFIAFLQHETMNEVRRWDMRFHLPSATPIATQLIGGTSVELPGGGA
jgi:hypothetical protein